MKISWQNALGLAHQVGLHTPVGRLLLSLRGDVVTAIDWADAESMPLHDQVSAEAVSQLCAYFADGSYTFRLPLHPAGTPFQRRVWQRLADIPPGEVASYGQLARELGTGPRALAAACRANPYPIVIPCHRVVAAHGLGGYCGGTDERWLAMKRWLLRHEGWSDA